MVTIWPSDGNGVGCKSQPSGRRARFFLLAAAGQQSPDLVVTAHVAGLGLVDIASEDLAYFVNLQSLDLADNELSYSSVLEQLAALQRVAKVSLACNLLSSLTLKEGGMLPDLQELDLSFYLSWT